MLSGTVRIMLDKTDIRSREDIHLLVQTFYNKLLDESQLAHYFQNIATHLDAHIYKITYFWEGQLLQVRSNYKGNPMQAHVELDEQHKHDLSQENFGEWLKFWTQTIDELFEGERAQLAKSRARNMATHLFIEIYQNRKHSDNEQ